MKIKCLIVDDKPLAIDILAKYISKTPFLELARTTTNPVEGLEILRTQPISLVFLDVQMPELNGLQFIKMAGKKVKIILTTAYSKYALDGYDHDVIDYLLKPVAFDRFYRAAEKAFEIIQINKEGHLPVILEGNQISANWLFVKTEHRIQKINLDDIHYIEGLQNYISLQMTTQRILSLQPLKRIQEQLPPDRFAQVHRSFIVSIRHISFIERSHILINETAIPIGNNYRDAFFKIIGKF